MRNTSLVRLTEANHYQFPLSILFNQGCFHLGILRAAVPYCWSSSARISQAICNHRLLNGISKGLTRPTHFFPNADYVFTVQSTPESGGLVQGLCGVRPADILPSKGRRA